MCKKVSRAGEQGALQGAYLGSQDAEAVAYVVNLGRREPAPTQPGLQGASFAVQSTLLRCHSGHRL